MEGNQFNQLMRQLEKIQRTQDEQKGEIQQIKDCVVGNPEFGHKGLVSEVKELNEFREKHNTQKNRLIGAFSIITATGWVVLEFLKDKISDLFN